MIDEAKIAKAERRWLGKRVYITRGFYAGHWGYVASAESEDSFILRGGTLGSMEPLVDREEFRTMRGDEYQLSSH